MTEKLYIHEQSCKGCGYCIKECPKTALSLSGAINSKGYATIQVDHDVCICCGICYAVCPDYVFEIREENGRE